MSTISDLRPGDIGFGPLNTKAARLLVDAGQLLLGEGFRVGALRIEHVFVVTTEALSATHDYEGSDPVIVEAMPGGACKTMMTGRWTDEYAYVRIPEDYAGQGQDAAAIARAMIGTPYSFASYAALAAWRFGMRTSKLEKWINRRKPFVPLDLHDPNREQPDMVALPAEAICSVLADQAWSLTGKQIMHGVAHQCVTPGALAARLLEMPGAQWFWPGRD